MDRGPAAGGRHVDIPKGGKCTQVKKKDVIKMIHDIEPSNEGYIDFPLSLPPRGHADESRRRRG